MYCSPSVLRPLSLKLVSRRRKLVVGLRATRIVVRMRAIASEVPLGTVAVVTEPELLNVLFSRALTNFQVPLMLRGNRCRNRCRVNVDLCVRIGVTVSASLYKVLLVVVVTKNVV